MNSAIFFTAVQFRLFYVQDIFLANVIKVFAAHSHCSVHHPPWCCDHGFLRTASLQVSAYTTGQAMAPSSLQDCHADVQKVEMVLETYSMHIDSTYNKLQFLKEYIDDTEVQSALHLPLCAISQSKEIQLAPCRTATMFVRVKLFAMMQTH